MGAVDSVPLHCNDVEVGAVHVERVADVVGDPLVDEPHLHDVADVDLKVNFNSNTFGNCTKKLDHLKKKKTFQL